MIPRLPLEHESKDKTERVHIAVISTQPFFPKEGTLFDEKASPVKLLELELTLFD